MKNTQKLIALALALLMLAGLGVSALADEPAVTVTDMGGREITLKEPASRVVALTAADCEILYAIGAGETLVGRGEYCDYPAEVFDVPSVQSGYETNIEQIIALEPQVVLMGTMAQSVEQVEALEKAGIAVVVSDAQDIEGVYTAIRMIGKLMGYDDNAEALVAGMQDTFAGLKEASKGDGSESIYFVFLRSNGNRSNLSQWEMVYNREKWQNNLLI